jgi:hypothetical protein
MKMLMDNILLVILDKNNNGKFPSVISYRNRNKIEKK